MLLLEIIFQNTLSMVSWSKLVSSLNSSVRASMSFKLSWDVFAELVSVKENSDSRYNDSVKELEYELG